MKGLVRLYGTPLGFVDVPVVSGRCPVESIKRAIVDKLGWSIINNQLYNLLATSPNQLRFSDLVTATRNFDPDNYVLPMVTVAVCTRDRSDDLAICLEASAIVSVVKSTMIFSRRHGHHPVMPDYMHR